MNRLTLAAVLTPLLMTLPTNPLCAQGQIAASVSEWKPAELRVPSGFTVEAVAKPPMVNHPVFATFDDEGNLFVCENAGVNLSAAELEDKLPNSVLKLVDTNHDGIYDRSTVFADKMTFPMGGAWHRGSLYVASPPFIWRLTDADHDGVAESRTPIVGKFGSTGNAADIHGCINGPDGRLYWADGYHGHEFRDAAGQVTSKREGSYLFSCKADGSDVRLECGGGMDNPVEFDFTDEGDMIGVVNIMYTRPRVDCLVHWLYGGAYPHREKVLNELKQTGDWLGPIHRFGHVAISGATRYRSGQIDPAWQGNFLTTMFNTGKVVRLEIQPDKSSYQVTQREFLSSTSREFHPTDVTEDADGSVLVVDTGGWFYRGCPTSQFAKPDLRGAIYRIRKPDMKRVTDPRGQAIAWSQLSTVEQIGLLSDPRPVVQERAIEALALTKGDITAPLKEGLNNGSPQTQRNILWTITRKKGDSPDIGGLRALVHQSLSAKDVSVRHVAARSLRTYPDESSLQELLNRLAVETAHGVRRELATALGRLKQPKAIAPLLQRLPRAVDRSEEHAILFALIEIGDPVEVRKGLSSELAAIRRGALIALDQMKDSPLGVKDVVEQISTNDPALKLTAVQIFGKHPEWSSHASAIVVEMIRKLGTPQGDPASLRQVLRRFLADPATGNVVGELLNRQEAPAATRELLLASLSESSGVSLHASWAPAITALLDSSNPSDVETGVKILESVAAPAFKARLESIGANESNPVPLRIAALQAASGKKGVLSPEAFTLLERELSSGTASSSAKAAQKLGASLLTPDQMIQLAPHLQSAAPTQLADLIKPYLRSNDPKVGKAFLDAIGPARSLTHLAIHEFSDVIKRYPPELLPVANGILDTLKQHHQQQLDRLDTFLPKLSTGDARRGAQIFASEKAKCATCHRVGDQGGRIGPDLTTIGANRAPRDLLESIVFPSATIVRDYGTYTVELKDGRVLNGLIVKETTDSVVLQQQAGEPLTLARSTIEGMSPNPVSIMPNGLDQALTEEQLIDVIAYLVSLKPTEISSSNSNKGTLP